LVVAAEIQKGEKTSEKGGAYKPLEREEVPSGVMQTRREGARNERQACARRWDEWR